MTKCVAKTRKVGGSIVITLPKEMVDAQKIRDNEYVEVEVKKCRKNGFGALKGLAPFSTEDELKAFE